MLPQHAYSRAVSEELMATIGQMLMAQGAQPNVAIVSLGEPADVDRGNLMAWSPGINPYAPALPLPGATMQNPYLQQSAEWEASEPVDSASRLERALKGFSERLDGALRNQELLLRELRATNNEVRSAHQKIDALGRVVTELSSQFSDRGQ